MASAVTSRYAKALAELVARADSGVSPQDAVAQLRDFEEIYRASAELRNVLLSPAVPAARKRGVVAKLAAAESFAALIRNFLYVVIDHRRIGELAAIREAFEAQIDERMGLVSVKVASAQEVNSGQRQRLETALQRITGKQVRAAYSVDASLLGGAVARIGSVTYDGSVRGELDQLRRKLEAE